VDESLYDQVGGEHFFVRLVDAFYVGVESDETLRAMYPEDLADSKRHLALFLAQYWGGPATYMAERGHPRLRLRHAPFRITRAARDAWLAAMNAALASVRDELTDDQFAELSAYFEMAASQLRNV
jgi:hemoglobin